MKKKHKIQFTFDEATGELTVRHFTAVEFGGLPVTHHQDIEADAESVETIKGYMAGAIDANREAMEQAAEVAAVTHVAALAGTIKAKQLTFKGGIVAKSQADHKKGTKDAAPSAQS